MNNKNKWKILTMNFCKRKKVNMVKLKIKFINYLKISYINFFLKHYIFFCDNARIHKAKALDKSQD